MPSQSLASFELLRNLNKFKKSTEESEISKFLSEDKKLFIVSIYFIDFRGFLFVAQSESSFTLFQNNLNYLHKTNC